MIFVCGSGILYVGRLALQRYLVLRQDAAAHQRPLE
jgi:hypothetical protein